MYYLGNKSISNLAGVHPNLVKLVHGAIEITQQDFGVNEGLRSIETQEKYVKRGVSKTMESKHLKQSDGFGHAVDLVPYINGQYRWEWALIYPIARAMQSVAIQHKIAIRWGGVWDKILNGLTSDLKTEVYLYQDRHQGSDFLDGPHYELV
jgi:peptidoglycan L-alanyl-D-glutamate endopeptidase CwlK